MIEAKVVCDSISPEGHRLTTFQLRYPKFIHGEFMTHRQLSRNASSSRAVPTKKLIEEVRTDHLRAGPVYWGTNKTGMQAGPEIDWDGRLLAMNTWAMAAQFAADSAEALLSINIHKQIANRLLEPFSHINVVATATEWDNFFGLRLHQDAQPEMRTLAEKMWEVRQASRPDECAPGQWHLPFCTLEDPEVAELDAGPVRHFAKTTGVPTVEIARYVSVARCARVSYASFETGKRSTVEEDLTLFKRLLGAQPLHASPAEHQATPDSFIHPLSREVFQGEEKAEWKNRNQWGNFVGWRQYRKMLPGESCAPLPAGYSE